jgi:hypothetical protein
MRLLERQGDGSFSLTENLLDQDVCRYPYAILSHRWGNAKEEVTFEDMVKGLGRDKTGYKKIEFCGEQASKDGLKYFWVDSCCIKKSSDSELSESINSMYRWYNRAARCYVYLSDVSIGKDDGYPSQSTWDASFRASEWFTRGWTLQELLAPNLVEFFTQERMRLGDKSSLGQQIHEITGIALQALQGISLSHFSVDERFKWAQKRNTTREEDQAYCLLGIFNISMPVIYGEGKDRAATRLRKEIREASNGSWNIEQSLSLSTSQIVHRPEWKSILSQYSKLQKVDIHRMLTLAGIPGTDLLEHLSNYDHRREYSRRARKKLEHTTEWILKEPDFESWLHNGQPQCLWLTGISTFS